MKLTRQRIALLGIFALFFGPVILVMLMRSSWWQYQPAGLKNLGQLVQPPVQLTLEQTGGIEGKWLVLYQLEQPCGQACIEQVTTLRQIHRAAGRHADSLGVVLLARPAVDADLKIRLDSIYPEFVLLADPAGVAAHTLASINTALAENMGGSKPARTYILDPMLNVILAYTVDSDPNDIHKDLRRLLKWSDQEK